MAESGGGGSGPFGGEIHSHDLQPRRANLARTRVRAKDASPPKNSPRREGTVIHVDSIRVHPNPGLQRLVEAFRDGRVPYLPAGALIQAHVGWYRLLQDVGLILPDDKEFKRRDKTKVAKRRILNEDGDEHELYQASLPADPIDVEEFDTHKLREFENLFRSRVYVGEIREREKREISRVGEYTKLVPDRLDLERGFIPILTNPGFFMRGRFPQPVPTSANPTLF
ncbi:hypothetical protein A3G67_05115 [Candidatus Roizmanbacteria bacterium RIFCSPLOWO2_12_FULL_40_12]|uniref:Uncharacterized protein n=1 Tax=Candidatus Roizmanbacteria bacterium RIFCSPLOWO2_01_FULL_40_42 TaxID=1802066 RepID=A0A1F7J4D7_9BACT|nr:MAG: hypothetical protein A2779_04040 [Candidatus Roizmanbacteria bacterium RIFCSPHIGHO2_01_FULL_40_98]OGK27248.1 MAG: hypothetical protein A3C31_04365 [Candidatus Roizmanbacteria bacterium RIFCSPHIGHO2_02_FULL_40_53]OGK30880.1 MAG: hypothetical protein A2W49_02675 [Candidatus Roizmanbacteria bacterium RIFCSPHIGHO2_12_41_18]OGK36353.1 MAG: hypothetical protein A3E69_01990 [Candidatus Roizmanbacteria bacterium RIFCSPHIGHO2_12_FULL_40_130]OGK50481.1 MAG: hypothetical protein A3B50_01720 [Candi